MVASAAVDRFPSRKRPGAWPLPSPQSRAAGALLAACLLACPGAQDRDLGASAAVRRERIERIVVATGTVEPEKELEVRPRIPGIIETIHVDEGDAVEEDQPLVEIERDLLASAVSDSAAAWAIFTRAMRSELFSARLRPASSCSAPSARRTPFSPASRSTLW